MVGGRREGQWRTLLLGGLAGLSALLVALLAVATNLATSAVPEAFRRWAEDPRWTWGATALLVGLVVAVGVALQRLSSSSTVPAADDRPGKSETAEASYTLLRIEDADPQRLGVHAAIVEAGVRRDSPPTYVPRDIDLDEGSGLRARLSTTSEQGGFVLLVGGSSVGKTRTAYEAVRTVLAGWWLIHPGSTSEIEAVAGHPPERTVLWLDETQRYLTGESGLTGGLVRRLIEAKLVIVGTLWPNLYSAYMTSPQPGNLDQFACEREVLELAAPPVYLNGALSSNEIARAQTAAADDSRIRHALDYPQYGLTQTLAAAPQLVGRWREAESGQPYAWAVLTAAIDAGRLGARHPLDTEFLATAAVDYCSPVQQASATGDWLTQAMAYLTAPLHGASSALAPVPGKAMGTISGYRVADYLLQYVGHVRASTRIPASTWTALLPSNNNPADDRRLAVSAANRLLFSVAVFSYRRAIDAGDSESVHGLADLLVDLGDCDEVNELLSARIGPSDGRTVMRLIKNLVAAGRVDEAVAWRNSYIDVAGAHPAGHRLTHWREDADVALGDADVAIDRMRQQANPDNPYASNWLAKQLARRGEISELRARSRGNFRVAVQLLHLLNARGELDDAVTHTEVDVDANDKNFVHAFTNELIRQIGKTCSPADTFAAVRALSTANSEWSAMMLAEILSTHGEREKGMAATLAELASESGNTIAPIYLADILSRRGDVTTLRSRAHRGDKHAAAKLADLLAAQGQFDEALALVRRRVDAGEGRSPAVVVPQPHAGANDERSVGDQMAHILHLSGRTAEATRLRQFGLNPDGSIADGLVNPALSAAEAETH